MIKIESTNPKFSWILRKNPETQRTKNEPFSKALRKGMSYGWFTTDQQFNLLFIDSKTETSFNTIGDFEYLDRTRYCSPYLPIALIANLLASAQKEDVPEDTADFQTTIEFISEFSDPKLAHRVIKTVTDAKIELVQMQHHLYNVKISATGVRKALNWTIAFLITQAVLDPMIYIPMDDESVKKYINALNIVDAPYYMRYITANKCIKSPVVFDTVKNSLENEKFQMNFGDSQNHRWLAIEKHLNGGAALFDIGCGELYYTRRLYNRYEKFFAFDADEKIQDRNKHLVNLRCQDKIDLLGKFDSTYADGSITDKDDVLLTEVLEHMPKETAVELLDQVLRGDFRRVVVTVPNVDFNRFYGLYGDDKRHPDHHYEPTQTEFETWMKNAASKVGCGVEFFNVGDGVIVNGQSIYASLGATFKKEKNE